MNYNPKIHHRCSIRLNNYDYSQNGLYFITICVHNRECLLGNIEQAKLKVNNCGEIVKNTWFDLTNHNDNIYQHAFIVMPNHIHGIIELNSDSKKNQNNFSKPLSEIVRQLKTFSAKRINQLRKTTGMPVWQRSYYEHIIRSEKSYNQISEYIIHNQATWNDDKYYIAPL